MHAPMRTRGGAGARWSRATRRAGLVVGTMALAGGLLTACGGSSSGSSQSLTLYSGQHEQTTDSLVAGFEKATGITVNVRNDDEDVLADQIATEGSHSPADVFFTENSPPLEYLQGKGLLSKVESTTLAKTPSKYNSPTGHWVGVSARVSVLIYNPSLIAKEPAADVGPASWPTPSTRASWPWRPGRRTSSPSSRRWPGPTATRRPSSGSTA